MYEYPRYKLIGCRTRKVLIEKEIPDEKKLIWVITNEIKSRQNKDFTSEHKWQKLKDYYMSHPRKFEWLFYKVKNADIG